MKKTENHRMDGDVFRFAGRRILQQYVLLMLAMPLLLGASSTEGVEDDAPASTGNNDEMKFGLEIYMWAPSISGGTRRGRDADISFQDILDKLQFSGMMAAGIKKGKWSLLGDVIYMDLEGDVGVTSRQNTKLTMESWIVHLGGAYTVFKNEDVSLDVLAGARYLYMDVDAGIQRSDISVSKGVWNGIAGMKGRIELPEQWFCTYYADAGTGESKFTWQLMGSVGYEFQKFDAFLGYRHMVWNFDEDDTLGRAFKNLAISGPYAGVLFVF
ncbi:MAG TPA: hypothetical protein VLL07_05435 [Pontiella sp.]|nr:hypothetical protein [Pontiella sp.]